MVYRNKKDDYEEKRNWFKVFSIFLIIIGVINLFVTFIRYQIWNEFDNNSLTRPSFSFLKPTSHRVEQ